MRRLSFTSFSAMSGLLLRVLCAMLVFALSGCAGLGERAELTPREFNLLWALADRPGRVVTHESLLEQVWGPAHRHDLDYLRVAIRSLRRKLEVAPATPRLLINEPGVGYRVAET